MPSKHASDKKTLHAEPNNVIYAFSAKTEPRLIVEDGETVVLHTMDCFGGQIRSSHDKFDSVDWSGINPATGPVYVNGAKKGDTLAVEIHEVAVHDPGVMVTVPGAGAAPDRVKEAHTIMVPIKNGLVHLPGDIILEAKPMIGVIGTAPATGESPTGNPGLHGGNMDTVVIGEGATVYLPVEVDGALLAMGDLHALMGDGEVLFCGVEAAGSVTAVLNVHKGLSLPCPVIETDQAFYTVWSAETLDEAAHGAVDRALDIMIASLECTAEDALILLSAKGNLQVSQVVDPLKTARMEIPKSILKGKNLVG